ncbi:MAG TPA: SpaA isopeptide-forming pilin-related protein [Candidatus Limnocylindria bacterium]
MERPRASLGQIGLAMLAVLALTFSFFTLAQPARADHVEGSTVQLNQDLGAGVDSSDPGEFAGSDEDCADVEEGTVLFHFVANQLAEGTTSGTLYATFEGMAEPVEAEGYFPSGKDSGPTMHFDVVLTESATLLDAYAHFNVAQTEDTNLLLSHVCDKTDDEVSEDLTLVKQVNGQATEGIGFTLEGWSELFTDASGQILFEGLTEGEWTLTETTNPNEACETGGSVTITVAADGSITVTDDDETDGLVIVSFDAETNVLVLNNDCEVVVDNGLLEVEKFFCPTDGETRTEFDVFGPAEPQVGIMNETEGEQEGCTIGAGVEFTVYAADGETWVADLVTGEDGIVEHELAPGDYVLCEDASGECVAFSIASNQVTAIVVVNYVAEEEGPGLLEVEKFFCPTDGETRTEFDIFGPADPQSRVMGQTEVDTEDCTVGADVSFTLYSVSGDEWTEIDTLVTDEDGIIEIELAAGDYAICEDMSEECAEFSIGPDGAVTAIVVVNYVAAPQGQVKILKYFCDAEEDSVEFYLEGQAPNLENCDPGDAEFTLDGGESFWTEGGIAVIWADEGTHTLAEVGTGASVELDVVEGEITSVIVLNNQAAEEEQGQLQVLKYFCEGEVAGTEFFAEGDEPDLTGCEPGDAMFRVDDGEAFSTVEGEAWVNLDAGTGYVLTELSSEAWTEFDIAAGEVTTITVVNTLVTDVPQGQIKVLKYECLSDEDGVEFVLEGDAPADLEDCDPADAEFSLDGGAAFSTTDGIAIVWADEGTHTLAEVETDASVEVEVVADAIATVIVLNHVEADVSGGDEDNGNGGEGAVRGGQGGPGGGTLPDTAVQEPGGLPAGVLALMLLGLGGLGAANLQAVRRRIG